jgi:hypothetical protein
MFSFLKKQKPQSPEERQALSDFIQEEGIRGQEQKNLEKTAALNLFQGEALQTDVTIRDKDVIESQEQAERLISRLHTRLSSFTEAATSFTERRTNDGSLQHLVDGRIYNEFFSDKGELGKILELVSLAENLLLFVEDSKQNSVKNIQASEKYIAEANKRYDRLASKRQVMAFIGRYARK